MIVLGVKSFFEDGTASVQLWDGITGEQLGEFEQNSPKIPKDCILCDTVSEFTHRIYLAQKWRNANGKVQMAIQNNGKHCPNIQRCTQTGMGEPHQIPHT